MTRRIGIIGGGILGSSIAYHLSLYEGVEPWVIEKNLIGSGTTARSAGTVCLLDDSLPEEFFGIRVLALQTYKEMERESPGSAGFVQCGTLVACPNAQVLDFVKKGIELSRKYGFSASFLESTEDIKKRVPDVSTEGLLGAGYTDEDGYVDATAISVTYAKKAAARGAKVLTGTKVTEVKKTGNGIRLITNKGDFDFDSVINASGPWAHQVDGMVSVELPLFHTKAEVFVLKPRKDVGAHVPIVKYPLFYTKPEGSRIFACRAHLTMSASKSEDSGIFDPDALPLSGGTDQNFLEFLTNEFLHNVPSWADSAVTNDYLAYRMETVDYLPVVGPSKVPGFVLAVGAGGNGVLLAPTIGRSIARLVALGSEDEFLRRFRYTRFA